VSERIIIGYRPHTGQLKLHKFLDTPGKYYIINCGRQFGKTLFIINCMLYWCFNIEAGSMPANVWYVAPSYKLVKITYAKILRAITDKESGNFDKTLIKSINKTTFSIDFANGSRLSLHSGEVPGNLRGDSITHLVYDESAHMTKFTELWDALQPATMVTGKKVVAISTPLGRNKFFELFQKGIDTTNKLYHSIKAPSWENPYFSKEEMEEIKRNSPLQFAQEYCGDFLEDSSTVFKFLDSSIYFENLSFNSYNPNFLYTMGVDLAVKNDYSVGIIYEVETNRVVDMFRMNFTKWDFVLEHLTNLYKKWNVSYGYVEDNHNSRIYEELVSKGCKNLQPFTTGYDNKAQIIQNLQLLFERKEIRIPNHDQMIMELRQFAMRFNPKSNKIFFSAPSGLHDDIPIALSLACHAIKDAKKKKSTFQYFKM